MSTHALINRLFHVHLVLVFVPLGFVAHWASWPDTIVTLCNVAAIIPLSARLSAASDTIGNRWGDLVGGLINATFGNTVELIVGFLAILRHEPRLAQSMMIGSILSDILLVRQLPRPPRASEGSLMPPQVQGCCFITAARGTGVLNVNSAIADTLSTLMIITTVALVLPAALYSTFASKSGSERELRRMVLNFSRATAVVLLCVYAAYLYFQLKTHSSIFVGADDEHDENLHHDQGASPPSPLPQRQVASDEVSHTDRPSMSDIAVAALTLVISGLLIAKCTANFMDSLHGTAQALNISKTFIAIIIMPLASNASELAQVVAASKNQKIDFAIGVIIGSILQISLLVLPLLVVVGWALRLHMDLYFEPSQTYILLLAVITVNQVLQDKHYTFLHGALLISV
ncbi:Sodium/calcium exchanger membrane region [Metarhizium album ARSEF 1941]|uniref:Sodium/calcium exchanger membrane region n=1 Tax=Metarhizium album (strain ARSEF 1941) TaxID=1081103 RepID=A0A0B2X2C8_METAS|nr:Sodium/calcium exchanger membrane region [Metarhizium album ARSEF 1941]KHO00419.1 Sodium/calcium exchanger membrane region [Metarhizium album ARSEF 1941]